MRLIKRNSDAEYVESLRHPWRRRYIGATVFLLLGFYALFRVIRYGAEMHRNYREAADAVLDMAVPADQQVRMTTENFSFMSGVMVGYGTLLALMIGVLSISVAIHFLVRTRKERLLIKFYDESHSQDVK